MGKGVGYNNWKRKDKEVITKNRVLER